MDALAVSPHVKPGRPDESPLVRRLVDFGGPMMAVFSPVELEVMRTWIASLPDQPEGLPLHSSAPPTYASASVPVPARERTWPGGDGSAPCVEVEHAAADLIPPQLLSRVPAGKWRTAVRRLIAETLGSGN